MSIQFSIPNCPTKVDYLASSVADNGATIPIVNKPSLSAVATSGQYTDLLGKPASVTPPTSVDYNASTSTATTLAITNKPTIPTSVDYTAASSSGTTLAIVNKPSLATVATSGKFGDLTGTITQTLTAANGISLSGPAMASGTQAFPPTAMTANTNAAGFSITASSTNNQANVNQNWYAFDRNATRRWASSGVTGFKYDGNGGTTYTGPNSSTTVSGTVINGEWLQLQTPVPYRLVNYVVTDTNARQKAWTLAGSVDGVTWSLIDSQSLTTIPSVATTYTPSVSPQPAYSYFRYIVTVVIGFNVTDLDDIYFNGQPVAPNQALLGGSPVAPSTFNTLGSFGYTGTTPSVQSASAGSFILRGNGAGAYRYVQFWYYAPVTVDVAAGDVFVNANNTGSLIAPWEYIDPSLGFAFGNLQPSTQTFDQASVPTYVGFVNLTTPTFASPTNFTGPANTFQNLNSLAFTLPQGWHEFRLYFQGNESYLIMQNSLSLSNCYAAPPVSVFNCALSVNPPVICKDVETKRLVSSRMTVSGQSFIGLRYSYPYFVKYNLGVSFALAATTTTTPPSSAWSENSPLGAPGIMQTDGTLKIRYTGVYSITGSYYFNTPNQCQFSIATNDAGLGSLMYVAANNALNTNTVAWTGRLVTGTILTPQYYMGVAGTLVGSDARFINALTVQMMFTCV